MKKIPQTFLKWLNTHFQDEKDEIDVQQEYDRELTVNENREAFKEKFKSIYRESSSEARQRLKAEQEKAKTEKVRNEFVQRKAYLEDRFGIEL